LLQHHTPEVIVIDEIRATDMSAVATAQAHGVRVVASARGSVRQLYQTAQLNGLLGGFIQV
jgi:stage III sporulation protein SpoIIIAA